jgi:hypothetical protein
MKRTRKIIAAALLSLACAGMAGFLSSSWYLWHLASRVPVPERGLVHPRVVGTGEEFAQQFTVYLSSTESALLFEELYIGVCGAALLLLLPVLWWRRFPSRTHAT